MLVLKWVAFQLDFIFYRASLENGLKSDGENGTKTKKCCSGLCVDLLRKFEDDLGFTYELTRVQDPKWGTLEVYKSIGFRGKSNSFERCPYPYLKEGLLYDAAAVFDQKFSALTLLFVCHRMENGMD